MISPYVRDSYGSALSNLSLILNLTPSSKTLGRPCKKSKKFLSLYSFPLL